MQIDTVADVKLVGRALSAGWMDDTQGKRKQAVDALFGVIAESPDPAMKIKAFEALTKADSVDIKRAEMELKQQERDDQRRLQLLELVKHLPAGEMSRIASNHKAATEV